MAYLDGAIVKTVARHKTPMARHDGVCNHIAVSNGASLFNYFNQPGNPTSHFYVRKGSSKPGVTMADFEQYVDTRFQAPANLEGNHRLISIETQGGVGDDLDQGWNPLQLERLAWILAQCHQLHGIPLIAMPNSLPTTRGLGYHRLGVDPWRVDGGEKWSRSYGKVCPGPARIKQQGLIIARARAIVAGTPPEDDMQFTDKIAGLTDPDGSAVTVGEALARAVKGYSYVIKDGPIEKRVSTLEARVDPDTDAHSDYAYAAVTEGGVVDRRLDDLKAALANIPLPPPDADAEVRLAAVEAILAKFKDALEGN